jgi:DNA invertase Pin-like site-specific DNA recombinase
LFDTVFSDMNDARRGAMASIGYARVSTGGQDLGAQRAALRAAGCAEVVEETGSGADRARPELVGLLRRLRPGDTLVVVRIDRLARSLGHLLSVMAALKARGVGFRSLGDPIDTEGPSGTLVLQILGAVAEFERALIRERTLAGLAAARAAGRVGGNPRLRARDPEALARLRASRRAALLARALREAEFWIGAVRKHRPALPWRLVAARVNASLPPGQRPFSEARLKRLARLLVGEGLLEPGALAPARPARGGGNGEGRRAVEIAAAYLRGRPEATLAELGAALLRLGVLPPRGGKAWARSSLKALVDRARRQGLAPAPGVQSSALSVQESGQESGAGPADRVIPRDRNAL